MISDKVLNRTTPLCFMPDGSLVCYQCGRIIVQYNGGIAKIISLPVGFKERCLGWCKLATRLFRFGIRTAIALDYDNTIFSIGNKLFELNLRDGELSKGWYCGDGIRPLIFSKVKGIEGFDDCICFGGYLANDWKKPVHIYCRVGVDQWEVKYTFPQGAINHVHNIVPDPYRNCLWVFTGDFDEASAIWKITDNFNKVERVAYKDQKYRSCVVYALPKGLLYATDAPFADDYIYLLNPYTMETTEVFPIHGSCIYGCKWKDNYLFSSTVEGDGRNMSRMEWLFTRKRGAGIKDDYVHMYMGNLEKGFTEIYKEKKDRMPYYTFQFGVFKFPTGINNGNVLFFQPVATKRNDLRLMSITSNE